MTAGLCFLIWISGQSVPLGLLAASTLRMKCFWSPYICILASAAISDPSIWSAIVAKVNSFFRRWKNKYFFRSGVRSAQQEGDELHKAPHPPLCHPPSCKPSEAHHRQGNGGKQQESQSLKFKTSSVPPPRTSGSSTTLTQSTWCSGSTRTRSPTTPSPARCSCSPGWNCAQGGPWLTTHTLRTRRSGIGQRNSTRCTQRWVLLARRLIKTCFCNQVSPLVVHTNLRKYNASYVILEDSICLAHRERCSTPDIMDLTNGHVTNHLKNLIHLHSQFGFCSINDHF